MSSYNVIIVGAGRSTRYGDGKNKIYCLIMQRPVFMYSIQIFRIRDDVDEVVFVISPEDLEYVQGTYGDILKHYKVRIVLGGATRATSVLNGFRALNSVTDYVAIHDAARPCLTSKMVESVFAKVNTCDAAILAAPVTDTIKRVDINKKIVLSTERRAEFWLAQTPQVISTGIMQMYTDNNNNNNNRNVYDDDSAFYEACGVPVHVVESDASNIKITYQNDMIIAESILRSRSQENG